MGAAGLLLAGSGHGPMPPWHCATAVVVPLWERKGGAEGGEVGEGADLDLDPSDLRLRLSTAATVGPPTRCARLHRLWREEKEEREEREPMERKERESPMRGPAFGFAWRRERRGVWAPTEPTERVGSIMYIYRPDIEKWATRWASTVLTQAGHIVCLLQK